MCRVNNNNKSAARRQLDKHVSVAVEELLETVFSMRSVPNFTESFLAETHSETPMLGGVTGLPCSWER
jgi:hypothetical protein